MGTHQKVLIDNMKDQKIQMHNIDSQNGFTAPVFAHAPDPNQQKHILSGETNSSIGAIGISQQRIGSNRPVSRDGKVRAAHIAKQGGQYSQHRQQVNNFFQFGGPQGAHQTAKGMQNRTSTNMTSNNFFPQKQLASQNSGMLSQNASSRHAIAFSRKHQGI